MCVCSSLTKLFYDPVSTQRLPSQRFPGSFPSLRRPAVIAHPALSSTRAHTQCKQRVTPLRNKSSVCQTLCSPLSPAFWSLLHSGCGRASFATGTVFQNPWQHSATSANVTTVLGTKGSSWATQRSAVIPLGYITAPPWTTQSQSLWSHLVQPPAPAGPPGEGCPDAQVAFGDGDDMSLRMQRDTGKWRQTGHTFSEGTYNFVYFRYLILNNKKVLIVHLPQHPSP